MRVLLFGNNGQLGWEFQCILPSFGELVALDYEDLDLADLSALQRTLDEIKPNLIVNASAYTAVDQAESHEDLAEAINGLAPGVMAEAARKSGALLLHFSTDYVFDGSKGSSYVESDSTNPLNVYGRSKLAGERNIQQVGGAYVILRTSWVYSARGQSFVSKTLAWARKNRVLKIVSDQVGNPTWARSLAGTSALMLARAGDDMPDFFHQHGDLYHLAGSGHASRFEWAQEILANDPNPDEQVVEVMESALTVDFPVSAQRPLFSALDCSRFENEFGLCLPDWKQSLRLALS
jgi:dTDP-4-dehydrorhamnose reductase